ncbi:MAG: hypothetical protein M3O72_05180 [Verrucomicrobiota bacterium]|nr:hypothetical protein [Verrucomicrobiota bacterium]
MENSRRRVLLATLGVLFLRVASSEQISSAPADQIAPPITVRASSNATGAASKFLTTFISTAVRLDGAKFISCLATAVKLRPDLAGKIVVCALNISRLNAHPLTGRLSFGTIDQIIKAAVAAAPGAASDIVKAAIQSEPYARAYIIAAALSAAPDQESSIRTTVNETTPTSILLLVASFNPTENRQPANVNSPEQPPVGP